jgi:hypothetical protein
MEKKLEKKRAREALSARRRDLLHHEEKGEGKRTEWGGGKEGER